jgi:hypothetical protein
MRILFFLHNISKTRHFDRALEQLAQRGHSIVLASVRQRNRPLALPKNLVLANKALIEQRQRGRIEVIACPAHRLDAWTTLAPALRRIRDYLRFADPRYAGKAKLEQRSRENVPAWLGDMVERHPWVRRHHRAVSAVLGAIERLTPSDRLFDLFIRYERPDLVLVTPLVDYGSYQTDYVKSAHRLGIPVVFMPFSWDNLTNRGLIRVAPDRVLAWNDIQRREAIELHGVPADRVAVVGAARFDDFFTMSAATTREAFCRRSRLRSDRRLLLYLCSSEFVAPHEVAFVRRWIDAVRAAADPEVRTASVLVRPHPAHLKPWKGVDWTGLDDVATWGEKETMQADQGLYDSLHHADAIVGLNTSAIIEGAILGKAAHTIVTPEFAGGQAQTLHFDYLRAANGGPLHEADGLEAHVRQLAASLGDQAAARARSLAFAERFTRPRGLDRPVTPILVDEIERAATLRKAPRRPGVLARTVDAGVRVAAGLGLRISE